MLELPCLLRLRRSCFSEHPHSLIVIYASSYIIIDSKFDWCQRKLFLDEFPSEEGDLVCSTDQHSFHQRFHSRYKYLWSVKQKTVH